MLPRGFLKNDRGEFNLFTLFNEDNVFVPTYVNYGLNLSKARLTMNGGVHLSDTD
jgi:hypothetical protein